MVISPWNSAPRWPRNPVRVSSPRQVVDEAQEPEGEHREQDLAALDREVDGVPDADRAERRAAGFDDEHCDDDEHAPAGRQAVASVVRTLEHRGREHPSRAVLEELNGDGPDHQAEDDRHRAPAARVDHGCHHAGVGAVAPVPKP